MKFTIGTKLMTSFGLILLFLLFSGIFNVISFSINRQKADLTKNESAVFAQYANDMQIAVIQVQQWLTDISATRAKEGFDDGFDEAEAHAKDFHNLHNKFVETFTRENDSIWLKKMDDIKTAFTGYYEMGKKMANVYINQGEDEGNQFMEKFDPFAASINKKIEELKNYKITELNVSMQGIITNVDIAKNISIIIMVAAITVGTLLAVLISRSMVKNINKILIVSEKISQGDIKQEKINIKTTDEIGSIGQAFNKIITYISGKGKELEYIAEGNFNVDVNFASEQDQFADLFVKMVDSLKTKLEIIKKIAEGAGDFTVKVPLASDKDEFGIAIQNMLYSLNDILGQVKKSTVQISSGTDQIAGSAQSLSQGSTEQASSIEEMSASITQYSNQTKLNADNASQANTLTKTAMSSAEKGNKQMQNLVESFTRINNSTKEITKIVKTIDDIAFQINLLALNANVEAARAGKYGKGFAVVAEEVRNLANRSAHSVKETTKMVEEVTNNITDGDVLVKTTATQLSEIVDNTEKVLNLVEEITCSSNDQSKSIEQIMTGLNQIEQVTQSNSANAEENASSSEELSSQTNLLFNMINKFRLDESIQSSDDDITNLDNVSLQTVRTPLENVTKQVKPMVKKSTKIKTKMEKAPHEVIKLSEDDFGRF